MPAPDRPLTFLVRLFPAAAGRLRGVVEQVRTGRKDAVHGVEDVARVIEAALEKEAAMSLKGKHALVTGGSRGIGRGVALKLAAEGARVAVHYYANKAAATETLERVRKHGSDGVLVQADVSRVGDVERMFGEVGRQFGTLDVFVANARPELAKFYAKPMEITLEAWDHAVDSQAKSFLVGARAAVGMMGQGGRIVAITYAPGGQKGTWQPWIAMGSAKAALESLVRYFAVTLAPRGITVNAVSPGLTDDSVLNGLPQVVVDTARAWHGSGWTPMGRMGTPADIGNVVALLCSSDAGWITGQLIHADGGASLVDTLLPLEIQRG
jgi:NAD(P)-dependent dehydrogenase (short-subunit alcohol dehydrogenase family)